MKKKPTVTIGIPAFEEENTIGELIRSIFLQEKLNYVLENVVVVSDGGHDGTDRIVQDLQAKYKSLRLIRSNKNLGKATRLNQLFKANKSDVFIILDADITFGNNSVLSSLVANFKSDRVGIVSSNNQPAKSNTLVGNLVRASEILWYEIRKDVNRGDHIYNNSGCAVALSGNLVRKLRLPSDSTSDQHEIYLQTKKLGYDFIFVNDAIVFYQTQATLSDWADYLSRSNRKRKTNLKDYSISMTDRIVGFSNLLIRHPITAISGSIWTLFSKRIRLTRDPLNKRGTWRSLRSTKQEVAI